VDRETAVARKRVQDAETANMQELDHMGNVEMAGLTTTKPETTFEEMVNAIRDDLSDLASSEDIQDGEDKDDDEEDPELGKLSADDKPGWVMGTISKMVWHPMERFRQKQMRLDELTQLDWRVVAEYFCKRDIKYGTTELTVQAVVRPQTDPTASANNISVKVEWLGQSGRTLSEPSETPWWRITPRPASIPSVALHIALRSLCQRFYLLCRSPILNEHSGIVANRDPTLEWVHWVHACIGIAMRWVMLQKSLLAFLLPARKMQFSLYQLYTSFQVARSMWLLTIDRSFHPSHVLLLLAISGITCVQPTMFPTLKTCKATAAGAFLTCTDFQTGSKLPGFSGIVVSARANEYSTKAPSFFGSLISNSRCSCHRRRTFSVRYHLPGRRCSHTQSFG